MEKLKIVLLLCCITRALALSSETTSQVSVSVSCMMAYDEGGAPAVLESRECTHWSLSSLKNRNRNNCQHASLQGNRDYQEDRIACDLDLNIPILLGESEIKEVNVSVVAVFDGHGGKEASEMASQYFIDYFHLHSVFIMYKNIMMQSKERTPILRNQSDDDVGSAEHQLTLESDNQELPAFDKLFHLEILKDAVVKAIRDIDSKFSEEAIRNYLHAGTTAAVAIMVDGKILVANIGDSKALLCSTETESENAMHLLATELTKDHHPDRDDERARIKAAGGSVIIYGVPRVNGILAMSRAIGDVYLKRYGVISEPELNGWKPLTTHDKYLVVASDGIFESLAPQDVCDLILLSCSQSPSVAECIVATAYKKGSMDNLSAVIVPLSLSSASKTCEREL